jgi:uncharacterized protein (DUF2147 family)
MNTPLPLLALAASLSAMSAASAAPPAAPSAAPQGLWRFVDDGSVIEFLPCGGAVCGRVRGLPTVQEAGEPPPRCGQELLSGFKPDGARWLGEALDVASGRRYRSRLVWGSDGQGEGHWTLVVSAAGGLFSDSFRLAPAAGFKACA